MYHQVFETAIAGQPDWKERNRSPGRGATNSGQTSGAAGGFGTPMKKGPGVQAGAPRDQGVSQQPAS